MFHPEQLISVTLSASIQPSPSSSKSQSRHDLKFSSGKLSAFTSTIFSDCTTGSASVSVAMLSSVATTFPGSSAAFAGMAGVIPLNPSVIAMAIAKLLFLIKILLSFLGCAHAS